MKARHSPFYRITSKITAGDLQRSLGPHLDADENAYGAMQRREASTGGQEQFSLAVRGSTVVGCWAPVTEVADDDGSTVVDLAEPIKIEELVASNTSYFDLADLFATRPEFYLFVLDGHEITGSLTYWEMFGPVGQICMLSLTFMLEAAAEDLCRSIGSACWEVLPAHRQRELEKRASRRATPRNVSDPGVARLLRTTGLSDKRMMLLGTQALPSISDDHVAEIFDWVSKVRNVCGHQGDQEELHSLLDQREFARFLHGTQNLTESIRQRTQERTSG